MSLSPYIATCHTVLKTFPITCTLHAYGTTIEGEWDDIMAAIKQCHTALHKDGVPRIHTQLKIGTRTDKTQSAQDKIDAVTSQLRSRQ